MLNQFRYFLPTLSPVKILQLSIISIYSSFQRLSVCKSFSNPHPRPFLYLIRGSHPSCWFMVHNENNQAGVTRDKVLFYFGLLPLLCFLCCGDVHLTSCLPHLKPITQLFSLHLWLRWHKLNFPVCSCYSIKTPAPLVCYTLLTLEAIC